MKKEKFLLQISSGSSWHFLERRNSQSFFPTLEFCPWGDVTGRNLSQIFFMVEEELEIREILGNPGLRKKGRMDFPPPNSVKKQILGAPNPTRGDQTSFSCPANSEVLENLRVLKQEQDGDDTKSAQFCFSWSFPLHPSGFWAFSVFVFILTWQRGWGCSWAWFGWLKRGGKTLNSAPISLLCPSQVGNSIPSLLLPLWAGKHPGKHNPGWLGAEISSFFWPLKLIFSIIKGLVFHLLEFPAQSEGLKALYLAFPAAFLWILCTGWRLEIE